MTDFYEHPREQEFEPPAEPHKFLDIPTDIVAEIAARPHSQRLQQAERDDLAAHQKKVLEGRKDDGFQVRSAGG